MEKAIPQLLAGLNLTYNGPIVMSKVHRYPLPLRDWFLLQVIILHQFLQVLFVPK